MKNLNFELEEFGLVVLGSFCPNNEDGIPKLHSGASAQSISLIGNAGSLIWPHFNRGWQDFSSTDPLDHWIESVLGEIAARNDLDVAFPFKGPPYLPFQRWAMKTGGFSQSPLGVLVHPVYGPWFAFRGAFLSSEKHETADKVPSNGPCETCEEKPCLSACPVAAISLDKGYDVAACRSHLKSKPEVSCLQGCEARCACPVGTAFRYKVDHARFHMDAFVGNDDWN